MTWSSHDIFSEKTTPGVLNDLTISILHDLYTILVSTITLLFVGRNSIALVLFALICKTFTFVQFSSHSFSIILAGSTSFLQQLLANNMVVSSAYIINLAVGHYFYNVVDKYIEKKRTKNATLRHTHRYELNIANKTINKK